MITGFRFTAYNPIEFLGLVAIYDDVQLAGARSYGWVVDGPDIRTNLMEAAFHDDETG